MAGKQGMAAGTCLATLKLIIQKKEAGSWTGGVKNTATRKLREDATEKQWLEKKRLPEAWGLEVKHGGPELDGVVEG